MEKFEKIINGEKFIARHQYDNLDDVGRVELCWVVRNKEDYQIKIFLTRFEVFVPDCEDDNLELVIPLSGHYQNNYALSTDAESADKAFVAAYGLIQAMRHVTYAAFR